MKFWSFCVADQKFPKSASYQDFFAAADSFVEPFLRTLAELTSFHSLTYPHFFLVAMSRIQDIPTRMTRNKHTSSAPTFKSWPCWGSVAKKPDDSWIGRSGLVAFGKTDLILIKDHVFERGLLQVVNNLSAFSPVLPCGLLSSWIWHGPAPSSPLGLRQVIVG